MFPQNLAPFPFLAACTALSTAAVSGQTVAQCTPTFSDCAIPENTRFCSHFWLSRETSACFRTSTPIWPQLVTY